MAINRSFDCTEADLFCDEETNGFCFDDDRGEQTHAPLICCLTEESVGWMVERERMHLPKSDYLNRLRTGELDMGLRKQALDWIFKACSYHNFGELCLYLAVNYLDRFLSVYRLPEGKDWVIHLVAVSCLSLAAKLDEVNVPCMLDLQVGESKYLLEGKALFEGKALQRMEVLVMNYLNWNMKACTPFSFMDYFLEKANAAENEVPRASLIRRSAQIILSTIKGIDFLEFKPSEIAAAVAVYVLREMQAVEADEKALSGFVCVEKGRAVRCLELIRDLISVGESTSTVTAATGSVPRSPNGVLDAAFWSYKNGERTVGSCPSSSKRRKLDHTTTLSGGS